ncbi:MAG TPA: hypothetical protein VGD78_03625 [Chthoniobacterales bacterium]
MLDRFGIPHPANANVGRIAVLLNESLSVIAVTAFFRLARTHFDGIGFFVKWLIFSAIYGMLGEDLLRSFIMDVVVSHDWIYCLVENLPRPLEILIVCFLVVITAPRLEAAWMVVAGSMAIAVFAFNPPIDHLFDQIVASLGPDRGRVAGKHGKKKSVEDFLRAADVRFLSHEKLTVEPETFVVTLWERTRDWHKRAMAEFATVETRITAAGARNGRALRAGSRIVGHENVSVRFACRRWRPFAPEPKGRGARLREKFRLSPLLRRVWPL